MKSPVCLKALQCHPLVRRYLLLLVAILTIPASTLALSYECPLPVGNRNDRGDYACEALDKIDDYLDELTDAEREFKQALRVFDRCRRRVPRCALRHPDVVDRLRNAMSEVESLFSQLVSECQRSNGSSQVCEKKEARKYCRRLLRMNRTMRSPRNLREQVYQSQNMIKAMKKALKKRQRDLAREAVRNRYWCACLVLPFGAGPGAAGIRAFSNSENTCSSEPPLKNPPTCGEWFLTTGPFGGLTYRVADASDSCEQPPAPTTTPSASVTPTPTPAASSTASPAATASASGSY